MCRKEGFQFAVLAYDLHNTHNLQFSGHLQPAQEQGITAPFPNPPCPQSPRPGAAASKLLFLACAQWRASTLQFTFSLFWGGINLRGGLLKGTEWFTFYLKMTDRWPLLISTLPFAPHQDRTQQPQPGHQETQAQARRGGPWPRGGGETLLLPQTASSAAARARPRATGPSGDNLQRCSRNHMGKCCKKWRSLPAGLRRHCLSCRVHAKLSPSETATPKTPTEESLGRHHSPLAFTRRMLMKVWSPQILNYKAHRPPKRKSASGSHHTWPSSLVHSQNPVLPVGNFFYLQTPAVSNPAVQPGSELPLSSEQPFPCSMGIRHHETPTNQLWQRPQKTPSLEHHQYRALHLQTAPVCQRENHIIPVTPLRGARAHSSTNTRTTWHTLPGKRLYWT